MESSNKALLKVNNSRPVVYLKIFTTGNNPKVDRIYYMSAQKIMPNGDEVIGTRKLNPETKLSLECTKESGVTSEELLKEPTFAIVAEKFHSFISDSDLYGFNIKKEIHFLIEEFRRAGILFNGIKKNIFDLKEIYEKLAPHTFENLLKESNGQEMDKNHIYSPMEINALTKKMSNFLKNKISPQDSNVEDSEMINDFLKEDLKKIDIEGFILKDESGDFILNYGKNYKGQTIKFLFDNNHEHISWLLKNENLPTDTKDVLRMIVDKYQHNKILEKQS